MFISGPTAKLEAGMTLAKINNSNVTQSVKNKQIELFNKYNTNGDDTIDANEFAAYEKDEKKSFWKKVAIGAGVAVAGLALGYLAYKGIKGLKTAKTLANEAANTNGSTSFADEFKEAVAKATDNSKTNYKAIADDLVSKAPTPAQHTAKAAELEKAFGGTTPWEQRASGYGLYEKGVVGPGSKEVTDLAGNFHAGLDHSKPMTLVGQGIKEPVSIEIVDKPTFQANRWGGFGTDYNLRPGDGRMLYGNQSVDYMDDRWKKLFGSKGITEAMDGAGSMRGADGKIILSSTYREVRPDGTIGDYLGDKLNVLGSKHIGVKDADMGIMIPTRSMKTILTSEGQRIAVKPGTYVAADALGVYCPSVGKVDKFFKKNAPTGDLAEAIAAKITKFEGIKANATKYVQEGKLSGQEGKRLIAKAWDALQRWSESLAA